MTPFLQLLSYQNGIMRCHPFIYLCLLVTIITLFNVFYITRTSKKAWRPTDARRKDVQVSLLPNDENSILARIRYPNRQACVLYGQLPINTASSRGRQAEDMASNRLVLGIASVARPPGVEYLTKTLHKVIEALDEDEAKSVQIVIAMMDKEKRTREDRAKILYRKFRTEVESGLILIVGPPTNIYPSHNFYLLRRRPFNNTVERMEWQTKLSLDFAFLFSFASGLGSDFFMNLEDDIVPISHFVREAFAFMDSMQEEWSSLQFSNYLSIGRLYRCRDLSLLVDLILISYTRQPVDFIMHHFDVLQMADHFKEFRRNPPLLEHFGAQSTIDVESIRAKVTRKYEAFKKSNPPAQLTTNMVSWQNFSLDAAYRPHLGHFFWARHFKSGDAIQVAFKKAQNIRAIYIVTGFDKDEERAGNDRLVQGELLASANQDCSSWSLVTRQVDQWGKIAANLTMPKIHCLQVKVFKGTSDWLVIRLIRVMLMYSH